MTDARPRPLPQLDQIATRVRSRGVREVVGLARSRLIETIASGDTLIFLVRPADGIFLVRPADEILPDRVADGPAPARPSLEVRRATSEDGERYARDIGTDSPRSFRARLSPAEDCYVVDDGAKLLHATWMTTSGAWTRELRRYLRPPMGDAYVYESFTRADSRGRGLYPFALEHICRDVAAQGISRVWVAVEGGNPSSLKAVAKAGFRPVTEVRYRRSWGRLTVDVGPSSTAGPSLRVDIQPHSTSLRGQN